MAGDVHPNPGPITKYPCPVCTRNITSRGVSNQYNRCSGWVHAKCYGTYMQHSIGEIKNGPATLLNLKDPATMTSPTQVPSAEQISDDSTCNGLQFNANVIGNKLTELGVVLERNKVKVAVNNNNIYLKSNIQCI